MSENPDFLAAKFREELIVLNVDIRGSTSLAQQLQAAGNDGPNRYRRIIQQYHERAGDLARKHHGVLDKTMGDGIQIISNVYRDNVLPVEPSFRLEDAKVHAITCGLELLNDFDTLIEDLFGEVHWPIDRPAGLCLGAGLAVGNGYVGSFASRDLAGLEYSVHGDVANLAGHLVGEARREILADYITKTNVWKPKSKVKEKLLDQEVHELSDIIRNHRKGIEVADIQFGTAVLKTTQCFIIRRPAPRNPERLILLLLP